MIVIKVDGVVSRTGDSGKPIVADDVKVGNDLSGGEIENERNCTGVIGAEAKVHVSFAAWTPFGNLLAVSEFAIKYVCGAAPEVEVCKALTRKGGFRKNFNWRETSFWVGNAVVETNCVVNG